MARGNRGGRGGSGDYNRGGGRGQGRGGRGGRGRGGFGHGLSDGQVVSQNLDAPRGGRGRGRGARGGYTPSRGSFAGDLGPKDRFRQKMLDRKLKNGATPLSQLLFEDRPYLKPIVFVRSTITPSLFMDEEEIFEPVVEATEVEQEKSHAPTADAVSRVFHIPTDDDEGLEEIDFADLGEAVAEIEVLAARQKTGCYVDATASDDDEEVIVYDAPYPKIRAPVEAAPPAAPASDDDPAQDATRAPPPNLDHISFSFAQPSCPGPSTTPRRTPHRPRSLLYQRPVGGGPSRRKLAKHPLFGSFGAMLSESRLQEEIERERVDRKEERRRDSDVDWGDSDEDGGQGEQGAEGMQVDEGVGVSGMEAFVRSMSVSGQQQMGAGDLEDEQRMRVEDEQSEGGSGSSSSSEEIVVEEETRPKAEPGDVPASPSSEDSSDDDDGSFRSRLRKLRERSKSKGKHRQSQANFALDSNDDDFDPDFDIGWDTNGEDREIQEVVDEYMLENAEILGGRDRKARNALFRQVHNGEFEIAEVPAPRKKDKGKHLSPELADQWARDREKKADRKHERELERFLAASDTLAQKKGGKKARKALRAAIQSDSADLPNKVFDVNSLETQIRRFVDDLGSMGAMALPPMEKYARKVVHELATAFGLKSQSKGKGGGRYTSLVKTSRTGVRVNEGKVRAIVRRGGGVVSVTGGGGGKGGPRGGTVRPREGEEVGKAAPKIGETNIGFKMLASMGWEEGMRIGGETGGIEVPLTAVVKTTKLGLGATR